MDLKLQKRNHASLRKLTKVDENNNVIEGQSDLYVRVEDVPSNLLNNDATPLSEEVFEKINWKDNNALLFTQIDTLPEPISGVTQIVSLNSGQVWCIPGGNVAAFKLGADDLALYLKKINQTYEDIKLLGSNAKIGALPADYNDNGNAAASTYLDIYDGDIYFKIKGQSAYEFKDNCISFANGNWELNLDTNKILFSNNSNILIGLQNGTFSIKGNKTHITEDIDNSKLNCYTNLDTAVYGTNNLYIEFNSQQAAFKTSSATLLKVGNDGSLYAYGPIYANGSNRVIDSSIINSYIKTYLDNNFESRFLECYGNVSTTKETYFEGAQTEVYFNISDDSSLFQINFSDTSDGTIMAIFFNGNNIDNLDKVYKSETGYYYLVDQYYTADDLESDYLRVLKYDSTGSGCGSVWIRGLYRL